MPEKLYNYINYYLVYIEIIESFNIPMMFHFMTIICFHKTFYTKTQQNLLFDLSFWQKEFAVSQYGNLSLEEFKVCGRTNIIRIEINSKRDLVSTISN